MSVDLDELRPGLGEGDVRDTRLGLRQLAQPGDALLGTGSLDAQKIPKRVESLVGRDHCLVVAEHRSATIDISRRMPTAAGEDQLMRSERPSQLSRRNVVHRRPLPIAELAAVSRESNVELADRGPNRRCTTLAARRPPILEAVE